jgi:hypothetical protein
MRRSQCQRWIAGLAAILVSGLAASAETSSWSRTQPATPGGSGSEAKIVRTAPQGKSAGPARPKAQRPEARGAQADVSTQDKTVAGDDAAYEAFDQGKYLTALDLATKAALKGDPQAHTLVGRIHDEGLGVAKDPVLAAQWFRRAAELGDVEGMFAFGVQLADGHGIRKDRVGAGQLFEMAAQRGHVLANYNLALLFLKGDGKPLNPRRAVDHLRYAAEKGIPVAQYDLGTLYATGFDLSAATGAEQGSANEASKINLGLNADAFQAAKWIGRAASSGHTEAELDYAILLFQGKGVAPDQKRGAELFLSAAAKGNVVAQNRIARCYAHGAGVELNLFEAAKWHAIAKAQGLNDETLDKLVAKLSRADRAKADRAAEEWREQARLLPQ